jgi:hypothetical protein
VALSATFHRAFDHGLIYLEENILATEPRKRTPINHIEPTRWPS